MASLGLTKNMSGLFERLEKQYKSLAEGGTSYRLETARLSLLVANKVMRFEVFLNLKTTRDVVQQLLVDANNERVNDVSKMLYLNAQTQYRKSKETPEFKAAVKQRMANRQPLKLVKQ